VRAGARPEREGKHEAQTIGAGCVVAVAVIGIAPAYANPKPHGNSCQTAETTQGGRTPGNAASSPGSVFNEPGINSPNGGKGGQAYSAVQAPTAPAGQNGAAAQYDTACANTLKTGTGTPMQTTPAPTQASNNSVATRAANNVVSHTGKGSTK
jgi:transcription elongation factor